MDNGYPTYTLPTIISIQLNFINTKYYFKLNKEINMFIRRYWKSELNTVQDTKQKQVAV